MDELVETEGFKAAGDWQEIWKLRVPPKVKVWLWRACRDCLPNRSRLQSRGIAVPLSCVVCGQGVENNWHSFIHCPYAINCWKHANLEQVVLSTANESEGFTELVFKILATFSNVDIGKFAMVAWNIWRQRNSKLWESSILTEAQTVFSALGVLCDWVAAKEKKEGLDNDRRMVAVDLNTTDSSTAWQKPPISFLKCNVDMATFHEQRMVGFGMILRNDRGEFVTARTSTSAGLISVKEGEALGLLHAIEWIREQGYQRVVFEVDSKVVADTVNSITLDFSEFGSIIRNCKQYL